jgi:hypothetical protein
MANQVTMKNDDREKVVNIEFDNKKLVSTIDKTTQPVQSVRITDENSNDITTQITQAQLNLGDLELRNPITGIGGKIVGIFPDEVVIFTEKTSPGCTWYWNGRKWIWRCK